MLKIHKRCIIGEGPIWNETEQKMYFTNGMGNEICMLDIYSSKLEVRSLDFGCAAFCFSKNNELIVSTDDGVFILNDDNTTSPIYDTDKYNIKYCNDMKVGPDGRIYVGTQSSKRKGVSGKIDGKLYSVDKYGNVLVLMDNLILSNGLEWSIDEKRFYHTDSDTQIIKEYNFDKKSGEISYTGREIKVPGVDGFTLDKNDNLLVACWGYGHIVVVDTADMQIKDYIKVPVKIPASCGFVGEDMEMKDKINPIMKKGTSIQLNCLIEPENTTYKEIAWTTSEEGLASIDENGLLTANATGIVIVTATTKCGRTDEIEIEIYSNTGLGVFGIGGSLAIVGVGVALWFKKRKKC